MATNHRYSPGCGVCLGVFHILCGLCSLGCGIAAVSLGALYHQIALGIWGGILFYGLTGLLAIASSGRSNSVIAAYYTFALLSVFVSIAQMGLYVWALLYEIDVCANSQYWQFSGSCPYFQVQHIILHGVLVNAGFLEWIFAMVSCCTACTCCCNSTVTPAQMVVIHTSQPVAMPMQQAYGGPTVAMPPAQQGAYGSQPMGYIPTTGPPPQPYPTKVALPDGPENSAAYSNTAFYANPPQGAGPSPSTKD